MYKKYEGNELFCYNCDHSWDVDNLNYKQTCPSCGCVTEGLSGATSICHNPFITCKCGARVYLDESVNECSGCSDKYNQDGEAMEEK